MAVSRARARWLDRPQPRPGQEHVTSVLGKLGAANRTEAIARARELGLLR
ncbi:MAG TPA: hypothetical protein VEG33_14775 [Streptosporangiaceae bacterium]|nr:hypothetical protein [Streptosporangiaceae bacterium]